MEKLKQSFYVNPIWQWTLIVVCLVSPWCSGPILISTRRILHISWQTVCILVGRQRLTLTLFLKVGMTFKIMKKYRKRQLNAFKLSENLGLITTWFQYWQLLSSHKGLSGRYIFLRRLGTVTMVWPDLSQVMIYASVLELATLIICLLKRGCAALKYLCISINMSMWCWYLYYGSSCEWF